MSRFSPIFSCAAGAVMLLAGCTGVPTQSGPQSSGPMPPNWSATPEPTAPVRPKPAPPVVVQTNTYKPAPFLTWTSLDRWAAEHNLAAPQQLAQSPVATYSIRSKNGTMILELNSHEATWRGMSLHLGFPPEKIDGQIFVHGLDLQKNLEPLLFGGTEPFLAGRVIVIDPGHGGPSSGTVSVLDGRCEKEFALDWALRLKPLLETNGWTVFLTRTNDTDIALSNRVAFATAHRANLFVSLHFNSSAPDKRQSGLETYCLTPVGMPSNLTRGYDDTVTRSFPNNAFDLPNLRVAMRLHESLLRATGENDRGVRRARFMGVLQGQRQPAVLLEGGYLSNPAEAARIATPEFRQKLAEAVAAALR